MTSSAPSAYLIKQATVLPFTPTAAGDLDLTPTQQDVLIVGDLIAQVADHIERLPEAVTVSDASHGRHLSKCHGPTPA
ncbi:MAG: hypothetical protein ACKO4L_04790, partial [Nodosilinea sp.]